MWLSTVCTRKSDWWTVSAVTGFKTRQRSLSVRMAISWDCGTNKSRAESPLKKTFLGLRRRKHYSCIFDLLVGCFTWFRFLRTTILSWENIARREVAAHGQLSQLANGALITFKSTRVLGSIAAVGSDRPRFALNCLIERPWSDYAKLRPTKTSIGIAREPVWHAQAPLRKRFASECCKKLKFLFK